MYIRFEIYDSFHKPINVKSEQTLSLRRRGQVTRPGIIEERQEVKDDKCFEASELNPFSYKFYEVDFHHLHACGVVSNFC